MQYNRTGKLYLRRGREARGEDQAKSLTYGLSRRVSVFVKTRYP